MLSFLIALGVIIGIVSGGVSIYEFIRSRQGRGFVYAVVALGLILAAVFLARFPSSGTGNVGSNPGSTVTPQSTKGNTSVPTQPSPTSTASVVKPSPTPIVTPTTSATDWGVLDGDAITVNKMLSCGSGCPDPLHVEVQTIQIDPGNNTATFTVHYSASVPNIAAGTVYFSDFSLQSDVTPQTEASQTPINSTQTIIAKFPFAPANNDIYTLTVSIEYQTISSYGTISITPSTINFEGVQMSFNS